VASIRKFLSEAVPEFDMFSADALVGEYKLNVFEALKNPKKVQEEITGVPPADLAASLAGWGKTMAICALSEVLVDGGLSISDIGAAVYKFGMDAALIIKDNPYRLMEIPGFNFGRVDKLAVGMGVSLKDPRRLEGAALWALNEGARNGHLYLRRGDLATLTLDIPDAAGPLPYATTEDRGFLKALKALLLRGAIKVEAGVGAYLPEMYMYERWTAEKLAKMIAPAALGVDFEPFLEEFERSSQLGLSSAQKDAVRLVIENKVLVLTGLPGTGKTMSVRALVRLFEAAKISFNLMAPTGIAAKRLAHVTGHPASTIHRALGYDGVEWKHGPNNRFITDAVIVDEVSMVDQELCYRLLSSLQDSTMLVFVGDDAQLPSVGPGNVLRELVACKDVPSIRLTKIFRQSQGGDIVSNSHLINQGDFPVLGNPKDNTEFGYICLSDEEKILSYIVRMARRLKDRDANFQVLTPKYDGVVGVNSLNSALRDILNPEGPPEWKGKHQHFRLGDRLMIIKNNYQKGIYNGDVGKLLYTGNDRLVVRVYGVGNNMDQEVAFTAGEAETYLRLAYAITVHKCLHPDTWVETGLGLVRAGDLPDEGLVQTAAGLRPYRGKVTNPVSPLITLTTRDQYKLTVTPTHGLDVWDPREECYVRKETQHIVVGDYVRMGLDLETGSNPRSLPPPPVFDPLINPPSIPDVLSLDLAEFLGMLVIEGHVGPRLFGIFTKQIEVADRFDALGLKLFGFKATRRIRYGGYFVRFRSAPVSHWLSTIYNVGNIPACILAAPPEVRCAFLRGLLEGSSVRFEGGSGLDYIELRPFGGRVLDVVRLLLLGCGIPTVQDLGGLPPARVFIYGAHCDTFRSKIGFISEAKQQALGQTKAPPTWSFVPIGTSELTIIAGLLAPLKSREKLAYSQGYMARHLLQGIVDRLSPTHGIHATVLGLKLRLKSHHTRVQSITTTEGPSVCVEVPDGHQFIQGGFYGWNSQGSEFDTILMPVVNSQGRMLQRNLLYTAVTRAKKKVWLLGEESAIRRAIANNKVVSRNTVFADAISGVIGKSEHSPREAETEDSV
jgi:exodeoxyribonuclease V alpha subunit